MKMLNDLLIGHNWPIMAVFVKLTNKINWLTQMSCIALMGIKRTVLIPTYQGKKCSSIEHLPLKLSSF